MCTLNITLSDTLMDRIRPCFSSQQALLAYAQKQLETMLTQFAEQSSLDVPAKSTVRHRHEELCGIFSDNVDANFLREEYIENKYGL